MKFLKTIFTALLLITTLIAGPGFSSIAQAEGDSAKRIDTLAAATTATVFAETSYQAYGGYNFENGTYWYRDGYPYPGQDRWNEGGWGFTATENYGSYHPDNCNSNIDPDGLCFMTGDRHGYYAPHTYWWCGWYNCYQGTNWYWDYGQRGYIQNGGNLNGQVYSDSSVRRVFYTSNNPSYYPSGPQHNVEVKDIIRGGWTQCWLGSFDDQRTYVEDIKNSCTGEYTIMAASTMDPVLSAPEAQYSALVASGDFVKTTFTLHNPDLISMNSITAKLTDAASGKEYLCSVDISNLDVTQVDAPLECIF
ncbi:MAG: hypothetical protein EBT07_11340, partial [Actinobacteria bacterium]|nr:hypothetical protein [Actinomycetota bacterium]